MTTEQTEQKNCGEKEFNKPWYHSPLERSSISCGLPNSTASKRYFLEYSIYNPSPYVLWCVLRNSLQRYYVDSSWIILDRFCFVAVLVIITAST